MSTRDRETAGGTAGAGARTVHPAHKTGSMRLHPDRQGPLRVELLVVGRELLKGRVRDANGPRLAELFTARGALIHRLSILDDDIGSISAAIRDALGRRAHLVVLTGGLGPAHDDVTLQAVTDATGLPLGPSALAKRMIEEAYARLAHRRVVGSAAMNAARDKLCAIPVGGEPLANPHGVSLGMLLRLTGGAAVLCLPGQPAETQAVLESALPVLDELAPRRHVGTREVETPTADESALKPLLDRLADEYPGLWIKTAAADYRDRGNRVVVTLEASASNAAETEKLLNAAVRRLLALAAGIR